MKQIRKDNFKAYIIASTAIAVMSWIGLYLYTFDSTPTRFGAKYHHFYLLILWLSPPVLILMLILEILGWKKANINPNKQLGARKLD